MNQPNQQQSKQQQATPPPQPPLETKPEKFKPTARTIFFVQTDAKFEERVRRHIQKTYGNGIENADRSLTPFRIVNSFDANKLREGSVILMFYQNSDALVRDAQSGFLRDRDRGEKVGGRWVRRPELPEIVESQPIACEKYMSTTGDDDGVKVNAVITALNDEIRRPFPNGGQPAIVHNADRDSKCILTLSEV